jgi:hypothetical protein
MSLQCRRMPSFLAIADFLRPQSLKLGSTFIYGVRISFESFSGVKFVCGLNAMLPNCAFPAPAVSPLNPREQLPEN